MGACGRTPAGPAGRAGAARLVLLLLTLLGVGLRSEVRAVPLRRVDAGESQCHLRCRGSPAVDYAATLASEAQMMFWSPLPAVAPFVGNASSLASWRRPAFADLGAMLLRQQDRLFSAESRPAGNGTSEPELQPLEGGIPRRLIECPVTMLPPEEALAVGRITHPTTGQAIFLVLGSQALTVLHAAAEIDGPTDIVAFGLDAGWLRPRLAGYGMSPDRQHLRVWLLVEAATGASQRARLDIRLDTFDLASAPEVALLSPAGGPGIVTWRPMPEGFPLVLLADGRLATGHPQPAEVALPCGRPASMALSMAWHSRTPPAGGPAGPLEGALSAPVTLAMSLAAEQGGHILLAGGLDQGLCPGDSRSIPLPAGVRPGGRVLLAPVHSAADGLQAFHYIEPAPAQPAGRVMARGEPGPGSGSTSAPSPSGPGSHSTDGPEAGSGSSGTSSLPGGGPTAEPGTADPSASAASSSAASSRDADASSGPGSSTEPTAEPPGPPPTRSGTKRRVFAVSLDSAQRVARFTELHMVEWDRQPMANDRAFEPDRLDVLFHAGTGQWLLSEGRLLLPLSGLEGDRTVLLSPTTGRLSCRRGLRMNPFFRSDRLCYGCAEGNAHIAGDASSCGYVCPVGCAACNHTGDCIACAPSHFQSSQGLCEPVRDHLLETGGPDSPALALVRDGHSVALARPFPGGIMSRNMSLMAPVPRRSATGGGGNAGAPAPGGAAGSLEHAVWWPIASVTGGASGGPGSGAAGSQSFSTSASGPGPEAGSGSTGSGAGPGAPETDSAPSSDSKAHPPDSTRRHVLHLDPAAGGGVCPGRLVPASAAGCAGPMAGRLVPRPVAVRPPLAVGDPAPSAGPSHQEGTFSPETGGVLAWSPEDGHLYHVSQAAGSGGEGPAAAAAMAQVRLGAGSWGPDVGAVAGLAVDFDPARQGNPQNSSFHIVICAATGMHLVPVSCRFGACVWGLASRTTAEPCERLVACSDRGAFFSVHRVSGTPTSTAVRRGVFTFPSQQRSSAPGGAALLGPILGSGPGTGPLACGTFAAPGSGLAQTDTWAAYMSWLAPFRFGPGAEPPVGGDVATVSPPSLRLLSEADLAAGQLGRIAASQPPPPAAGPHALAAARDGLVAMVMGRFSDRQADDLVVLAAVRGVAPPGGRQSGAPDSGWQLLATHYRNRARYQQTTNLASGVVQLLGSLPASPDSWPPQAGPFLRALVVDLNEDGLPDVVLSAGDRHIGLIMSREMDTLRVGATPGGLRQAVWLELPAGPGSEPPGPGSEPARARGARCEAGASGCGSTGPPGRAGAPVILRVHATRDSHAGNGSFSLVADLFRPGGSAGDALHRVSLAAGCPAGEFWSPGSGPAAGGECTACRAGCSACRGPAAADCLRCDLYQDGECVAACRGDSFPQDGVCIGCPAGCEECTRPGDNPSGAVVCPACRRGYFPEAGSCHPCPDLCAECTGPGACGACRPGARAYEGSCWAECPARTFLEGDRCVDCPGLCLECAPGGGAAGGPGSGGGVCTRCQPGLHLDPALGCVSATVPQCVRYTAAGGCLECAPGFLLLGDQQCVDGCPVGYMAAEGPSPADGPAMCRACGEGCTSCGPGAGASGRLVCDSCASGHYRTPAGGCGPCPAGCRVCADGGTCLSCQAGRFLQEGACVEACADGQYAEQQTCLACAPGCAACRGIDECTACQAGFDLEGGHCRSAANVCDISAGRPAIANCQLEHCGTCLQCRAAYRLDGGRCVACPEGRSSDGFTCCHVNCASCVGPNSYQCKSCPAGGGVLLPTTKSTALVVGSCVRQCPTGYVLRPAAGPDQPASCVSCPERCFLCAAPAGLPGASPNAGESGPCLGCERGYFLQEGRCEESCQGRTFGYGGACVPCAEGCVSCPGGVCSGCMPGRVLHMGRCEGATCPAGFYPEAGVCRLCGASCSTCSSGTGGCDTCAGNLLLVPTRGGPCVGACPSGHFPSTAPGGRARVCGECTADRTTRTRANQRNRCIPGRFLAVSSLTCLDECPPNTAEDLRDFTCHACPAGCHRCRVDYRVGGGTLAMMAAGLDASDPRAGLVSGRDLQLAPPRDIECEACASGYFLHEGKCQPFCPAGWTGSRPAAQHAALRSPVRSLPSWPPTSPDHHHQHHHHQQQQQQQQQEEEQEQSQQQSQQQQQRSLTSGGLCMKCHVSCLTCGDRDFRCTGCAEPAYLSGESCVLRCPFRTMTNATERRCDECPANCEACGEEGCSSCIAGHLLMDTPEGARCVGACPSGSFVQADRCLGCHESCRFGCSGPSTEDCFAKPHPASERRLALILGLSIGLGALMLILLAVAIWLLVVFVFRDLRARSKAVRDGNPVADAAEMTVLNTFIELSLPGSLQVNILEDFVASDESLGQGAQATVYTVRIVAPKILASAGAEQAAVKRMKAPSASADAKLYARFENEVAIMWALNAAPNVVRLYGYSTNPQAIVMELFDSCLRTLLLSDVEIPAMGMLDVAHQIACGLEAIHLANVAHCDIKTANIFMRIGPKPGKWQAAIGDFGTARSIGSSRSSALVHELPPLNALTARYASPEIFNSLARHAQLPDDECLPADVFAFSVVLWECLTRRVPWAGQTFEQIRSSVAAGHTLDLPSLDMLGLTPADDRHARLRALFSNCSDVSAGHRPTSTHCKVALAGMLD
ncbi:TKL protein kinase [Fonticula alba]|uniref:TKL protein kinase n=1 Tax=Fonticula alba TaxID=691883 RepID=A0A058ZIU4_FONAL|nr:TKL protein kinase [Fonticula alba]KCV73437.1 TKL protein kinase [Fonticula alba]|eukprot:XP_009493138.1 TKL protein kinase [Fonticula alba]